MEVSLFIRRPFMLMLMLYWLQAFGMEIDAAIDGYFRYIIWGYVGISARTSISVYRQYLDATQSNCFIPQVSRVDLKSRRPIK